MRPLLLLLLPTALAAPPLAEVGEALPGAVVERVERHQEYDRYHLALESGEALPVEVVPLSRGEGVCVANGATIFPRWEMLGRTIDQGSQPAAIATLCERLASSPPPDLELIVQDPEGDPAGGATEDRRDPADDPRAAPVFGGLPPMGRWHLAQLVGGIALLYAGWAAAARATRRDWGALAAISALSVAARLALGAAGLRGDGYSWLVQAWGYEGGPWGALCGLWSLAYDRAPAVSFAMTWIGSAMAAPLLLIGARAAAGPSGRLPGGVAAAALALLPAHARLAGCELPHPVAWSLLLLAAAALAGGLRARLPSPLALGLASGALGAALLSEAGPLPDASPAHRDEWRALSSGAPALREGVALLPRSEGALPLWMVAREITAPQVIWLRPPLDPEGPSISALLRGPGCEAGCEALLSSCAPEPISSAGDAALYALSCPAEAP